MSNEKEIQFTKEGHIDSAYHLLKRAVLKEFVTNTLKINKYSIKNIEYNINRSTSKWILCQIIAEVSNVSNQCIKSIKIKDENIKNCNPYSEDTKTPKKVYSAFIANTSDFCDTDRNNKRSNENEEKTEQEIEEEPTEYGVNNKILSGDKGGSTRAPEQSLNEIDIKLLSEAKGRSSIPPNKSMFGSDNKRLSENNGGPTRPPTQSINRKINKVLSEDIRWSSRPSKQSIIDVNNGILNGVNDGKIISDNNCKSDGYDVTKYECDTEILCGYKEGSTRPPEQSMFNINNKILCGEKGGLIKPPNRSINGKNDKGIIGDKKRWNNQKHDHSMRKLLGDDNVGIHDKVSKDFKAIKAETIQKTEEQKTEQKPQQEPKDKSINDNIATVLNGDNGGSKRTPDESINNKTLNGDNGASSKPVDQSMIGINNKILCGYNGGSTRPPDESMIGINNKILYGDNGASSKPVGQSMIGINNNILCGDNGGSTRPPDQSINGKSNKVLSGIIGGSTKPSNQSLNGKNGKVLWGDKGGLTKPPNQTDYNVKNNETWNNYKSDGYGSKNNPQFNPYNNAWDQNITYKPCSYDNVTNHNYGQHQLQQNGINQQIIYCTSPETKNRIKELENMVEALKASNEKEKDKIKQIKRENEEKREKQEKIEQMDEKLRKRQIEIESEIENDHKESELNVFGVNNKNLVKPVIDGFFETMMDILSDDRMKKIINDLNEEINNDLNEESN